MKKMFASQHIIQHNRLVRFVMLLIIIGLTVFLYTSYYANSIDRLPTSQGLRIPSLISISSNSNNLINSSAFQRHSNGTNTKLIENKVLNIVEHDTSNNLQQRSDNENLSDILSNIFSEDSIVQQSNIVGDDMNISFTQPQPDSSFSSSGFYSLPASLVSVATTQTKSAENNNLSSNAASNVMSVGKIAQNHIDGVDHQEQKNPLLTAINLKIKNFENKTNSMGQLDTTKGIRTSDLYEAGHSEPNSELCGSNSGEHVRLLILITSAPTHHDARLAIRQTWGHYATRRDIAMAFILGTTNIQAIEDSLEAESYMYSDIIRGRFIDSYNNLTLKTISSLEWVNTYCSHVDFVLKTDDDMFINVQRLMSFIDKHKSSERVIYGRLAKKWKPIRNKRSKYYVSPQQYFPSVFPQFTTGPAYLISGGAIHDLYLKALAQTYLKLEDVFTTGIVAQLVNVKRIHVNEFLNRRIAFNPCNLRKAISVHMVKANEQFDLWKKLLDTNTKCK